MKSKQRELKLQRNNLLRGMPFYAFVTFIASVPCLYHASCTNAIGEAYLTVPVHRRKDQKPWFKLRFSVSRPLGIFRLELQVPSALATSVDRIEVVCHLLVVSDFIIYSHIRDRNTKRTFRITHTANTDLLFANRLIQLRGLMIWCKLR